jgi:hypothetical protein
MSSCLASGTFAILESYQRYYNEARTHLSLCKDAPVARAVQAVGGVVAKPLLGRLHHRYIFLQRDQLRKRDTKTMSVTSSMHKRGHSDAIAERQRRPGGPWDNEVKPGSVIEYRVRPSASGLSGNEPSDYSYICDIEGHAG